MAYSVQAQPDPPVMRISGDMLNCCATLVGNAGEPRLQVVVDQGAYWLYAQHDGGTRYERRDIALTRAVCLVLRNLPTDPTQATMGT